MLYSDMYSYLTGSVKCDYMLICTSKPGFGLIVHMRAVYFNGKQRAASAASRALKSVEECFLSVLYWIYAREFTPEELSFNGYTTDKKRVYSRRNGLIRLKLVLLAYYTTIWCF